MLQFDVMDGRQPAINDFFRSHEVVQMGKEPYRCFFQSYTGREEALADSGADRWTVSLNGNWRFRFCEDIHTDISGMEKADYDDSGWDYSKVPSCWQGEGFELPLYSSCTTPFQPVKELLCPPEVADEANSMGIYRYTFEVPGHFSGRQVLIRFEGIESCFKLWMNGYFAGFGQNSFAPSEFNITQYLNKGRNVLCCQVYRWCACSHLEAQDMWRLSGIFRNVSLIAEPEVSILDFQVRTELDPEYDNSELKVMIKVANRTRKKAGPHYADIELYDAGGRPVGEQPLASGYTGRENPEWPVNTWRNWPVEPKYIFANSIRTVYLSANVEHPLKWTAETPNLYTLLIILKNEKGDVVEVARKRIGFRKVEVLEGRICINGKPVLLKGTNYHEFSAVSLRALTREDMVRDIVLMKRHNINAVRNSHYPHQALWYELCDEYGIYLMDEGNLETHDISYKDDVLPGNDLRYTFACLDRAAAMVQVSKNSPSVIIWSMGNECGYGQNIALMAAYCRTIDGTRLIHKRQMNTVADMDSDTYPGVEWIIERAKKAPERPFIMNEYAHAMGNAMGSLKDYWEAIEKYPCLCGAFIWEWCDHGIAAKDSDGNDIFAYGSDYPTRVNSGNFCIDGVVSPDRKITAKLLEVKAVYQYIKVRDIDIAHGKIAVYNGYGHISLKSFIGKWNIVRQNKMIASGDFGILDMKPGEWKTIQLDFDLTRLPAAGEYFFNASFELSEETAWAEKGYEAAAVQIQLPIGGGIKRIPAAAAGSMKVHIQEDKIWCENNLFSCEFSLKEGTLKKLAYEGREVSANGISGDVLGLQVFRAPTDNDLHSPSGIGENGWITYPLNHMEKRTENCGIISADERYCVLQSCIVYSCAVDTAFAADTGVRHYAVYRISADGTILMKNFIQPFGRLNTLPRLGVRMICDERLEHIRWFGRGPGESYPDRKEAALIGDYEGTVSSQMEHYVRPQENGNKEDVRFVTLTDQDGKGVHITGDMLFSFSALHFTADDLAKTLHDGQLIPRKETVLSLDYRQNGLGNSSCGGDVMEKYRLLPLESSFQLAFSRYDGKMDPYGITADFQGLPAIGEIFRIDHSISIRREKRALREPFDPSDEVERKKAGF